VNTKQKNTKNVPDQARAKTVGKIPLERDLKKRREKKIGVILLESGKILRLDPLQAGIL